LDQDSGWRLHPQVAIRPEPFGALLYHFGTRKLSFLKNRTILTVVQSLADHPDVRSACRAAALHDQPRNREGGFTGIDRKSTRLNSSHVKRHRMPSSA